MNRQIAIVSAVRSPLSKIPGALSSVSDTDLLAAVFREASSAGRYPDMAVAGCSFPIERDNLCRKAALAAGLGYDIPSSTVSKTCASSDEAFIIGCQAIWSGQADTVLVGGVEKNSNSPHILGVMKKKVKDSVRDTLPTFREAVGTMKENDMAYIAESLSARLGIGREELDCYTILSVQKAVAAGKAGHFKNEIIPVNYPIDGGTDILKEDELPGESRMDTDIRKALPMFLRDGRHTMYSAAPIADCAAAVMLMDMETARRRGIKPIAVVRGICSSGVKAGEIGMAMSNCILRLLKKTGISREEMDLFEINESFAAQALATIISAGIDAGKVNVNGGSLALGYPVGATGLRMLVTLAYELSRRQARYGMTVMCAGGYMAQAALIRGWDNH